MGLGSHHLYHVCGRWLGFGFIDCGTVCRGMGYFAEVFWGDRDVGEVSRGGLCETGRHGRHLSIFLWGVRACEGRARVAVLVLVFGRLSCMLRCDMAG